MDDSLHDAGSAITLSRAELDDIVGRAIAESQTVLWRVFCFILLLLSLVLFVGCVVARDQIRIQTAEMRAELSTLRIEVARLETVAMTFEADRAHSVHQVDAGWPSERSNCVVGGGLQTSAADTAAAECPGRLEGANTADGSISGETASKISDEGGMKVSMTSESGAGPFGESTESSAAFAGEHSEVLPVCPRIQLAPPDRVNAPGRTDARVRSSKRGVTVPSPIQRHDTTDASAERARLSVGRGVSFAPKRRTQPGVVVIGPAAEVVPVAFEDDSRLR